MLYSWKFDDYDHNEKFSCFFRKTRIETSRHFILICSYGYFPPIKLALPGSNSNNLPFLMSMKLFKKSTDSLMKEMQPLVFEKGRFLFQEKSDNFQLLANSVHDVCEPRKYSKNIILQQSSADKKC